jgi:hypothetical protein
MFRGLAATKPGNFPRMNGTNIKHLKLQSDRVRLSLVRLARDTAEG